MQEYELLINSAVVTPSKHQLAFSLVPTLVVPTLLLCRPSESGCNSLSPFAGGRTTRRPERLRTENRIDWDLASEWPRTRQGLAGQILPQSACRLVALAPESESP